MLELQLGFLRTPTTIYGWGTLQNTFKHVQGVTVQSAEDAGVQIELAALVAGGREALRERPLLSVISCPIAPLSFEACVDDAKGVSFEQLVIDAYIWECFREFMKEVEITEEKIGFDAIKAVGPGHEFLTHRHTLQHMRKDLTHWDEGKLDMLSKEPAALVAESRSIAAQLLKDHVVLPMDERVIRQGDEIIKAREDELAK